MIKENEDVPSQLKRSIPEIVDHQIAPIDLAISITSAIDGRYFISVISKKPDGPIEKWNDKEIGEFLKYVGQHYSSGE